jgi:hypothetical protein
VLSEPKFRTDVEIEIDYHAFLIYDENNADDQASDTAERALEDANNSGRRVGAADGIVAVMTAVQFNYRAPMRVELWPGEPGDDAANWDDVADIDLNAPTGKLMFRMYGPADEAVPCEAPAGRYRARISARGYIHSDPQGGGLDDYRVQLWPRDPCQGLARLGEDH